MASKKGTNVQEVRQCQDPESPHFGSTALKSLAPFGKWFIGNPGYPTLSAAGGHWSDDDELVKDWPVLGVSSGQ